MADDFPLIPALALVLAVCFVIGFPIIYVKFVKRRHPFFSKEYSGLPETIYAIENLKKRYDKGEITKEEFDKMTEEKVCNDPTPEKTREEIQHIYYGKEIIRESIPAWIQIKRELGSLFGITICKKCGTRTKMKYSESIDKLGNEWIGYTLCPKCGNKEKWLSGDEHGGVD